jgi:apolipoprotein N-acyltransferase
LPRPGRELSGAAAGPRGLPLLLLAASGGALYALGFVGFGAWPLALAAWPVLWAALEGPRAARPLRAGLAGLAFGAAACAVGYTWLWRLVEVFLGGSRLAGAALWLGHAAWFALGFALYALAYRGIRARGWPVALAGVAPLVALEWRFPVLFPVHLGNALVDRTLWIQTADLGGPLLLSAQTALASAALFESWRFARGRRARPVGTWLLAAVCAALAAGYGAWRIRWLEGAARAAPELRVGLVQANLGVLEKGDDPERALRMHREQTHELLAGGAVDLVVWPETVYARGIQGPLPVSGELIRGDLRAPLLFGVASLRSVGGRRLTFNSAFLIGADGAIRSGYDKNLLVPFAESVPVPALVGLFPHAQAFGAADETPPVELGPWRIATPICYEAASPSFVRRMVASARPQLIVSLANDGWFADSQEPRIHLAVARLRAVEQRRWLVRATNSGISAFVDPLGRVVARSGLLTRENLRGSVRLLECETLYGRFGDWPGWLACAGVALGLALPLPAAAGRSAGRQRRTRAR